MLGRVSRQFTRRLFSVQPPTKWQIRLARLDTLFINTISRFHEISGYSQIEKLKKEIDGTDHQISDMRARVRDARLAYTTFLNERQTKQKEINDLLMRKQAWKPVDLEQFTQLYKDDHLVQQNVTKSKTEYEQSEHKLEELQLNLSKLMSQRYREEQLWSDRIRQASTWGTFVLMGINIVLFIVVQLFLEPWKRRRLVRAFEEKISKDELKKDEMYKAEIRKVGLTPDEIIPVQNSEPVLDQTSADVEDSDSLGINHSPLTRDVSSSLKWDNLLTRLNEPSLVIRPVELLAISSASFALATLSAVVVLAFRR